MRELLAYSRSGAIEEKLTLRVRADSSGDVYIPTAWYSPDGTQNCSYDWMVGVDDKTPVNYKWTGTSSSKIRVGYWYTPLTIHTVIIRPNVDDYWWLRAFWYKGTDISSTLINIVSDKSYKGFALSSQYSGNYYKAYQYYGCINLLNTDEELLPDTLEIIGDYYRYYEYAWCTKLLYNAEEKILKTVKVIGDNYRAYQYQNCTSINKINMRAINWASVWDNYRYNQFEWVATDRKPTDIYIEWWIEEGGSWWLEDLKVKWVYVYRGLVDDYKVKLGDINEDKIQANADWDNLEYEFIEYIALADSNGEIRIPVGWYSTSFTQDCAYDWYVSIDWGEPEEISWTGGTTYVSVWSGLTEGSEHRVVIKPKTIDWGWWRAFGFQWTWAGGYIKELIHDSYKCYAVSRINTGNYYKYGVYVGCVNLINSYEKLPTSVEVVGDYYMVNCYAWCSGLITAFWEVMHKWCTIGSDYRKTEYAGCTSLAIHQWMAWLEGTYPSWYKDAYFGWAWDDLELCITRKESMYTLNVISGDRYTWNTMTLATITRKGQYVFTWVLQGTSSNTWFDVRFYQNSTLIYSDSAPDPGSEDLRIVFDCEVWDVIQIRKGTEQRYGNIHDMKLEFTNVLELNNSNVKSVKVFVDDLYDYCGNNNWNTIDDNKFQVYYYDYQPHFTVDISKYTRLLGTYTMPRRSADSSYSYYNIGWWNSSLRWVAPYSRTSTDVRVPWEAGGNGGTVLWRIYRVWWEEWQSVAIDRWKSYDYSTGSWGSVDGNVKNFYIDYSNKITGASYYRSNDGTVYRESFGRLSKSVNRWYDNWETAVCASRDGRYLWWNGNRYYAPTKWWNGTVDYGTYSWSYTNMDFSEDGMTMYASTNFWTITQYNLKAPRNTDVLTSTWNTLTVDWSWAFSKDFKYLYVYKGTLKVYEYVE